MDRDTKRCFRCKNEKPVSQFYKDTSKRDGLQSYCKDCESEKQKTPESRNQPSRRKSWAEGMFQTLRLNDSDY